MENDEVVIIIIEGNISSGKTTIMEQLASKGYSCFPENITELTPFLEDMYNGNEKQSDGLQMRIVVDQIQIYDKIKNLSTDAKRLSNGKRVVFVERWIGASQHVFIKSAANAEYITITPKGVKMWHDLVQVTGLRDVNIASYIYIHSNPDVVHERIKARSKLRPSERAVSLEYVHNIHNLYELYMDMTTNKMVLTNDYADTEAFKLSALDSILKHCLTL